MFEAIEKLLNATVETPTDEEYRLCETGDSPTEINVWQVPNNVIFVKCPKSQNLFNQEYNKICDYLIFVPRGNNWIVVFCELKETYRNIKRARMPKQLLDTIPLVQYIVAGLNRHFNIECKIIAHHYICIAAQVSNKIGKTSSYSKVKWEEIKHDKQVIKICVRTDISFTDICP